MFFSKFAVLTITLLKIDIIFIIFPDLYTIIGQLTWVQWKNIRQISGQNCDRRRKRTNDTDSMWRLAPL